MSVRANQVMSGLVLAGSILLMGACSSTMRVTAPDPQTGYYQTGTKVPPSAYIVKKPLDVAQFKQLLYIRTNPDPKDEFREFTKGLFVNLHFFDKVMDKPEMEKFVLAQSYGDDVSNISDLIGLNRLQKKLGNFLVADYSVQYVSAYTFTFDVVITNPANGEVVLQVSHKAVNWAGLDKPLFYPVFNAIQAWIQENSKKPTTGT